MLVSQKIRDRFGKQIGVGIVLAGLVQHLADFGRAAGLIDQIEGARFRRGGWRVFRDWRASGSFDQGGHVPVDDRFFQFGMDFEHVGAVAAGLIVRELFSGICGDGVEPLDDLYGGLELVVIGDGKKNGKGLGLAQELAAAEIRAAGEQHQRFHFGMATGRLNRIVDAAARAADADNIVGDAGL